MTGIEKKEGKGRQEVLKRRGQGFFLNSEERKTRTNGKEEGNMYVTIILVLKHTTTRLFSLNGRSCIYEPMYIPKIRYQ